MNITIGEMFGFVSTLINILHAMYGKTVVSPGYALNTWRNDNYGYYQSLPFGFHGKVEREPIMGIYLYERRTRQANGTYVTDKQPFPIVALRRLSYQCNQSGGTQTNIYNQLEEFTIIVYHAAPVVKTGLFPPGAPYNIVVLTGADKLTSNCTPITPYTREFRTQTQLGNTGSAILTIGWVNYQYQWPFVVWCGEVYDH